GCEQIESPDSEGAGDGLLRAQHLAKSQTCDTAQGEGALIVQGKCNVWALHQHVLTEHRRIPQVLQDRNVDLGVLLQPGMARELIERQNGQDQAGGGHRPVFHAAGVFSNCSFTQTRRGLSSSDFWKAWRASALRCALRKLSPSHRYASADLGSS